jgi:type VI secretion system secreted protein Hcp
MPIQIDEIVVAASAASDVFLHVQTKRAGKIKGEGVTEGHTDDIGVFTWGWGVSANTAIGSTERTARRSYKHLVITKGIDSASTGLLSALVSNDEVKEATLTMRKAGGEALDYFTMTLNDARVVAVDVEVASDGRPVERVAFAFTKIDIEYKQQQGAGLGSGSFSFNDEVMAAS